MEADVSDPVPEKKCSKCGLVKPLVEFYHDKSRADGFDVRCKVCAKKKSNIRYRLFPEKAKENSIAWYYSNKERAKKNKEEWVNNNIDKFKADKREWAKCNRNKINEICRNRYRDEPAFRLNQNLRTRTRNIIAKMGFSKSSPIAVILQCGWEELKLHLEKQFWPGMTWSNRGDWHIDHIRPLASAKSETELLELCHYTNLQPLWADDNLIKSDRTDWTPAESEHPLPQSSSGGLQ